MTTRPLSPLTMLLSRHTRRKFLATLLGGAAVGWPLAARAQQRERMPRIGVLAALSADDALAQARNAAFLQGLADLGWRVGRNVQIDFRWAGIDTARYPKYAVALVELAPDVILAVGASVVWPVWELPALCRVCSCRLPTPWVPATLRAWLGHAATRPGLPCSSLASARSGSNSLSRSRRA